MHDFQTDQLIYVVVKPLPSYIRDQDDSTAVIGVYHSADVAETVRKCSGHGAMTQAIKIGHVPDGVVEHGCAHGINFDLLTDNRI